MILLEEGSIVDIVTASVTLVCTLVGVIVTAAVSVKNLKKESYNKRVTEERVNWLNKVREDYSIIMGAYELKYAGDHNSEEPSIDKNEYDKKMIEAEQAKYDLISRLRVSAYSGNEYNASLKDILFEMHFVKYQKRLTPQKEAEFVMNMNFMLEAEWDKCKKETRQYE